MAAFSTSSSTQVTSSGGLTPVSTPTIINLELSVIGTEYSQVVPAGTKRIELKSRSNQLTRLAYTAGGTVTAFIQIPVGTNYFQFDLQVTSLTLYLQSPVAANNLIEITFWS